MAQSKVGSAPKRGATPPKKRTTAKDPVRRVVGAAVCLFLGLFTAIGYKVEGYWLIDAICLFVFKGLFGWGFYVVAPVMFFATWIIFTDRGKNLSLRLTGIFSLPLIVGAIVHTILCGVEYSMQYTGPVQYYTTGVSLESGGLCSAYLSELLREAVSAYGAIPLLIFLFMAGVLAALQVPFKSLFAKKPRPAAPQPAMDPAPEMVTLPAGMPRIFQRGAKSDKEEPPFNTAAGESDVGGHVSRPAPLTSASKPLEDNVPEMPKGLAPGGKLRRRNSEKLLDEMLANEKGPGGVKKPAGEKTPPVPEPVTALIDNFDDEEEEPSAKLTSREVRAAARQVTREIASAESPSAAYAFPPLQLLGTGTGVRVDGKEEIALNRERLETTLHSFGIGTSITSVTRGPSVTRYDLELEAGLRLSKLTNLAGDLALSLGVVSVRIAPIPGRVSTVGVEVPNKLISTVYLHDVLASSAFQSAKSRLTFAIGMDIAGNCIVGNIAKLPHMLIAGTTGSGKSVCMNCLIVSLLYKSTPEEVRLIMIDPKMVELGVYNGIPHLYIPVVTDPKKAAGALQWSVVEMMKRYRLFSEVGTRDLEGYNEYKCKLGEETLPSLVIVIDELADLMMTAAKEVEESICRVAQMGRAAGVHLIIATQRPSANVITGLMKANIPSRIAFAVSSAMESRIILDQSGAEKLLGMGDMLYSPIGVGKPVRIQGALVSDREREDIINYIKESGEAHYDENAMRDIERKAAEKDKEKEKDTGRERSPIADEIAADQSEDPFAAYDDLLPQAVDVILDTKQASVSMLQRRLKLGYSRAARLVDQMEELGIVGAFEGSKPRQILIDKQKWQEMSLAGRTPLERLMDEQKDDFSEERSL